MNAMQMARKGVLLSLMACVLTACAGGLSKVKSDGSTDQPVWPQWDKVTFDHGRGTFPDLTSLSEVKPGMSKDQLYYLLGRPHYNEAWRPVEWNYLFHFHTPGAGEHDVSTCQYKVLFDRDMRAQSFYWHPIHGSCPDDSKPIVQRYTLSADALFAFDRSTMADLNSRGRQDLDALAGDLRRLDELSRITVTGHTDYLGSAEYNRALSEQRAYTVRQYLIGQGVPAGKISAVGMGESQPVKQCSSTDRATLIACLAPNRRVEVQVDGSGRR